MGYGHYISPSGLSGFRSCNRCFWLEKNKKEKRPRGIFPSLPSGMDRVIKESMDRYRAEGKLPPELEPFRDDPGIKLFEDVNTLQRWRNWRTGLGFEGQGFKFVGALDDLLVDGNGIYYPFDYKTKGSPTTEEDSIKYYQQQLDCYALALEKNGMKTGGFGLLDYYTPKEILQSGIVEFNTQIIKIETDPARAMHTIEEAVKCLNGPIPDPMWGCEYCTYLADTTRPIREMKNAEKV